MKSDILSPTLGYVAELAARFWQDAERDAENDAYPPRVAREVITGWRQLSAIADELVRIYGPRKARANVAADILVTVAERYGHDPINAARVLLGRELNLDIVRAEREPVAQLSRNGLTPSEVAEWIQR